MKKVNHYQNVDLISGPCSAESRCQVLETARQLRDLGVQKFRAGVWKPRTRPGGFEGIGEPALKWLQEVREKEGMDVGCEVANKDQVKLALQHDLDFIWIGARTVVDPFAIQEISDALSTYATDEQRYVIEVYIKNPVCPDYDLWYGAYERIKNSGVVDVRMIFRGFKSWKSAKYRNEPIWDLPVKMMIEHPEIKMYCDPSHIAGKRELVGEVADMAINIYSMQGLMIESHCNPDEAITDAKQQLFPSDLSTLYIERESKTEEQNTNDLLKSCRNKIDEIDNQLVELIVKRLECCKKIGDIKAEHDIATFQPNRWDSVLHSVQDYAAHLASNVEYKDNVVYLIGEIFNKIHSTSITIQNEHS